MPLSSTPDLQSIRRWVLIATIALVEGTVWLNASESGVAKAPLFALGASVLLLLFVISVVLSGSFEVPLVRIFILIPLHLVMFLISFWWSFDPSYSCSALVFGVSCLVMFLTGTAAFPTKLFLKGFFRSLEVITAILCLVGALQLVFGDHLPVVFFVDPVRRIPSLLGNSIFFSSYLILIFPIVLSQVFIARERKLQSWARYVLLAAMAILLFATQTRSSIIAWVCSLILFALLTYRFGKQGRVIMIIAVIVLAGGVCATLTQPGLADRFTRMFDESRESTFARRMYFWRAGLDAFRASPIVGHGLGSFERTVFEYRSPDYWKVASEDIVPHAHNEILEIAVEYGVIGLALFASTFILVLRRGYLRSRSSDGWERWTSLGLLCAIVAIAVDNLGNVSLREPSIALPVWVFMGILWSKVFPLQEKTVFRISFPAGKVLAVLSIALWAIIAVAYSRTALRHVESEVHLAQGLLDPTENPAVTLAQYELAVQEDPANLFARSRLTQELLDLRRWDKALAASNALQQRSPMYPQSSLMKSYALLRLGRYQESLEWIGKELHERSHPVAYQIQAEAYRGVNNSEGEQAAIRQFLRGMVQMKSPLPYRKYCLRLAAIGRTALEKEKNEALLDSVGRCIPADREFFDQLKIRMDSTER